MKDFRKYFIKAQTPEGRWYLYDKMFDSYASAKSQANCLEKKLKQYAIVICKTI